MPIDSTVSLLINEEHKWNKTIIRQKFTPEDADQILKIMLPRSPRQDRHLWAYDKHGNYSVKKGYQVALKLKILSKKSPLEWHAI